MSRFLNISRFRNISFQIQYHIWLERMNILDLLSSGVNFAVNLILASQTLKDEPKTKEVERFNQITIDLIIIE
jgi:hypothetical protein